jgi:hypothetical protein
VDERRFSGHDRTVVSQNFPMELPGLGAQDFKIVVHSASARSNRGGTGFRATKGCGRVELKCALQLPIEDLDAPAVSVSFGVGRGGISSDDCASAASLPEMRGPIRHSFVERTCCGLKRNSQAFDLLKAVDPSTRKVTVHIEIRPEASS